MRSNRERWTNKACAHESRRENACGRRRSIVTLMLMARGAESRLWVNAKPLQCVLHARKARCARAAGQTCSRLPAPVHVASLSRARCSEPPDVCVGRSDIDTITFKCISVIFTLLHIVIEQSAPASPIPHRNRTCRGGGGMQTMCVVVSVRIGCPNMCVTPKTLGTRNTQQFT